MLSKTYAAILAVSVIVMAFFTFYAWSWLQSIGEPGDALSGYEYHASLAWTTLLITSLILLALANAVMWTSGRGWALWITFAYFTAFIVVRYFWLGNHSLAFQKENAMRDSTFSSGPFLAVLLIGLAGIIVFIDQFACVKLRTKIYGQPLTTEVDEVEEPTEENM